jgi:hypothetical protein
VAYFHENQLTYPVRREDERDLHFGMVNGTTALAADQVWFNSAFHRDSFLGALRALLQRMPDYNHLETVAAIARKSRVQPQGIDAPPAFLPRPPDRPPPLGARWSMTRIRNCSSAHLSLKGDGLDFV